MKIIGKTNSGFILEASKDDIAALENLYSYEKNFEIGDLVDVHKLFSKVETIEMKLNSMQRLRDCTKDINDAVEWILSFQEGLI